MKDKIIQWVNTIEDVLYPHYVCPFCETETPDGKVCDDCKTLLIKPNYCVKCGAHIPESANVCMQCKEIERIFDQNFSVYLYDGYVSGAIQKLKFKGAKYLAKDFAKILAEKFDRLEINVDVVTFVPSTAKRIKERGYNQAKEVALEFSKLVGLPCMDLLAKVKETAHQVDLNRKERLENLIDSFAVVDKWQVKGKNILVIDDVFTTGSTMTSCAKALKKAKAQKVYGLTLAKTEKKM